MTGEQFRRIERVFHAALEREAAARGAYLDAELAGEPELRRQVEALLEAAERGAAFLETSLVTGDSTPPASGAPPPRMIGPYRLIRELGRGGMGTVYEAEQSMPRRRVALKVVDGGLASDGGRMSGHEPRILGRLNHPSVATIYDADQTADGRSYFVMELIDGQRLDEYVERHHVPRRERLKLFCQVCDAIQHAHAKSVIHLDLKPSNVLVVPPKVSGQTDPLVKVVDFGVAALTSGDTTHAGRVTATSAFQGTLAYMSPEQRNGDRDAIDVRSDVYALGVILFKLMTGQLPYPVEGVPLPDAWRAFEQPPRRPRAIDPTVPRDIETIIRTATAEEPSRRYQSVAELASDVRRYLADLPIAARQPSKLYEWAKFAKRNKGLVATLLAILIGLVSTTVGTMIGLVQAGRAKADLHDLAAAFVFLSDQLASSQAPGEGADGTAETLRERTSFVRLRNALEVGRQAAERTFIEGRTAQAEADYAKLVKMAEVIFPAGYWYTARLRGEHGECLASMRRFSEAEPQLLASYEQLLTASGPEHPLTIEAMRRLVRLYKAWGRPAKASEWNALLPPPARLDL